MDQLAASEGDLAGAPAATEALVFRSRRAVGLAWAAGAEALAAVAVSVVLIRWFARSVHDGWWFPACLWLAGLPLCVHWLPLAFARPRRQPTLASLEPSGLRLVYGEDEFVHPWQTIIGRRFTEAGYEFQTSHGGTFVLNPWLVWRPRFEKLRTAIAARTDHQIAQHQADALQAGEAARLPRYFRAGIHASWVSMLLSQLCVVGWLGRSLFGHPHDAGDTWMFVGLLAFFALCLAIPVPGARRVVRLFWHEITFTPTHIRERWPGGRREIAYSEIDSIEKQGGRVVVASPDQQILLNRSMDFFDGAMELLRQRIAALPGEGR
jgi:hypothetical protein